MFQFSMKKTNIWCDGSRHVCLQSAAKIFIQTFTYLICIIFKCIKICLQISQKVVRIPRRYLCPFRSNRDAEFKNGVKTGTGSSFRRHFGENQISGFIGLVYQRYVYVRRRRDRPIDRSTGDALDELLCPGEPTPIKLSVAKSLTPLTVRPRL